MIAATHGNLVVSVTAGDGFYGLTLREKKLVRTKRMPRRGAGARKRRAEKRLFAKITSGDEDENNEISEVVEKGAVMKEFLNLIRKMEDNALDKKTSGDEDENEIQFPTG